MKHSIRQDLMKRRLSHEETAEKSKKIADFLFSLDEFKKAKTILCYMSIKNEVETIDIVTKAFKEKKVVLPITNDIKLSELSKFEFEKGSYNVPEPKVKKIVKPEVIDLAIIPGIAFDKHGSRIGYGKGYYDKLLKQVSAKKIALAYEFQIVQEIPTEAHDVKMDMIITEERVIQC